jgi:hypothetical protein
MSKQISPYAVWHPRSKRLMVGVSAVLCIYLKKKWTNSTLIVEKTDMSRQVLSHKPISLENKQPLINEVKIMSIQPRRIKRQLRDNRFSINLTIDETNLLTAASNLTGLKSVF